MSYTDQLRTAQREAAEAKQQRDRLKRRLNAVMQDKGITVPTAKPAPRRKIVKQTLGAADFKHLPGDVRKWLKGQASDDVPLMDVICGIIKDAHYEDTQGREISA